jgi:hypothetical protein
VLWLADPRDLCTFRDHLCALFAVPYKARFLTAILNSGVLTEAVRPLQARGEHNPRDFDKYVWQLPIPLFDAQDHTHLRLVELAGKAEQMVGAMDLDLGRQFEALRRQVRQAVAASDVGQEIDAIVDELLTT